MFHVPFCPLDRGIQPAADLASRPTDCHLRWRLMHACPNAATIDARHLRPLLGRFRAEGFAPLAQRPVVYVPCRGMADGDGAATGNTLASGVHGEDDVKSPLIATRARTHGQWDVCLHGTGTVSFPHHRSPDTVSSLLPSRNDGDGDGDDDDTTRNTGPAARTPLAPGSPRPFSSRPLSVSLVSPPQPAPWQPLHPFDPQPEEKEDLPAPSSANCPDTLLSLALSLASAVHLVPVTPRPAAPSFPAVRSVSVRRRRTPLYQSPLFLVPPGHPGADRFDFSRTPRTPDRSLATGARPHTRGIEFSPSD